MDLFGALRIFRKRWYVLLPALVLAAALTALTYVSIPTRFESKAVMVLTAPYSGPAFSPGTPPEEATRVNPLLAFDGSLSTTAQIITQVLRDPATVRDLGIEPDSGETYQLSTGDLGGPFVFITAESRDAARSTELAEIVVDRVAGELEDRQRRLQAPESTFITTQLLVSPTEADALIGSKVRFAGAMAAVALLGTVGITFGADSLIPALVRRRRSRADDDATEPEPAEPTVPEAAPLPTPPPRPTPRPRPAAPGLPSNETTEILAAVTPAPVPATSGGAGRATRNGGGPAG